MIHMLRLLLVAAAFGGLSSSVVSAAEPPTVFSYKAIECKLLKGDRCGADKGMVVEGSDSAPPPGPAPGSYRIGLPAIEFEFNSYQLTARALEQLDEVARALDLKTLRDFAFALQGHTDSVGGRDYNRRLSVRRAASVKRTLVAAGIDGHRLVDVGMGEDYPLPGMKPDDGRNRRVEIVRIGSADKGRTPFPSPNIRRRALLIGIGAYQSVGRLIGPVSDVKAMRAFVTGVLGYDERDVMLLLDADATRSGILGAMEEWLIDGTGPGDEVFIYFSGHGWQQLDTNGDEPDRYDETLVPVDVAVRADNTVDGMITDDEIGTMLARLDGRRINVIVDSCHAGTSDKMMVVGDHWRYVKSPRRPDGGPLKLRTADASQDVVRSSGADTFVSTKDPRFRTTDITVWAAVEAHQKALVDEEVRAPMSVFTSRLLTGARDAMADADADGTVTRSELYGYVLRESEAYCGRHPERCADGLTPQIHGASNAMDAPAFMPVAMTLLSNARAVKDILVGPVPNEDARADDRVQLRIEQGTRLAVGTAVDIVVTSPRSGDLVLLDVSPTGDMLQLFPNEFSLRDRVPTRIEAGEPKKVPGLADRTFRIRISPPTGAGTLVAVVSHGDSGQLAKLTAAHKDLSVIERPRAYLVELAEVLRANRDSPPHLSVASLVYETVAAP